MEGEGEGPLQTSAELAVHSYVSPLQKLVSAANRRNVEEVSDTSSNLEARTIRLTELADAAASVLDDDAGLVKYV